MLTCTREVARDTPDSDNDVMCAELKKDEGWKKSVNNTRPASLISDNDQKWVDITSGTILKLYFDCAVITWADFDAIIHLAVARFLGYRKSDLAIEKRNKRLPRATDENWRSFPNCPFNIVPLMMAYVTRFIYGTDKLRTNAFEVRGLNGVSSGIIHCDDLAILSQWLKSITDNIVGLTQLQVCHSIRSEFSFQFKSTQALAKRWWAIPNMLIIETISLVLQCYSCSVPDWWVSDEAVQSEFHRWRTHRVHGLG